MPKGLYTRSNSSKSSIGKYTREAGGASPKQEDKAVSTPRGKVLVGHDLEATLRRPSNVMSGLAPALPVSPPRSVSSKSSPATSPSRTRGHNASELRSLAQKHRVRDFKAESNSDLSSQRTSRSTLASFTSTGESVYEDAIEPESDDAEEVLNLDESDKILPPLEGEFLPDTPPELEVPERESRSRQITPKPNPQSQPSPTQLASPAPLSPEAVAFLDERTLYEQRQVDLQAEARRQASSRMSISSVQTSPPRSGPPTSRRHSGIVSRTTVPQSHFRRASLSSATSPPISGSRQRHLKPLVLTPARTMSTPLTSDSSHLSSPQRRLSTFDGSLDGGLRTHSRGSSYYDGTIRTTSPLSPGGHSAGSRSTSPYQSSPGRQGSTSGHVKRRSLGYVDSSNDPLSTFGRRAIGYDHRARSASEDTRVTRTTIDSALSRFTTTDGESPESSLGGSWSDGRQASPLLNDKEWEHQWQANGTSGTPLEMVAEVSSGDIKPIDFAEEDAQVHTDQHRFASAAPIMRRRAATDDRRSVASSGSRSGSLFETSLAVVKAPSMIRRDSVPPTPPPKLPLPRTPSSRHAPADVPNKRSRHINDDSWNSASLRHDRSPSISSVGDEDSDPPENSRKSMLTDTRPPTSSPRRPIVIKGTNSRSAAAQARRSARLSLAEPPLYPITTPSNRNSDYSSEQPLDSRPSSRASRHTEGHSSRESSSDVRFGAPLSTLREDGDSCPSDDFASYRYGTQRSQPLSERAPSRASYASPRISIGSTFANGFGATRKVDFEPRDPRTREELDAGQGSYLEVLLYSEPPPRPKKDSARWSTTTASTMATTSKKEPLGPPLIRSDSPPSQPIANKAKSGGNFAQKFFGGLRGKPALGSAIDKNSRLAPKKRPVSMMVPASTRVEQPKPRPIVSGPLELQRAEQEQKQQGLESGGTIPSNLSVSFAPPIPVMKSYTSLSRAYEQDSDSHHHHQLPRSGSRTSFETVDRPAPRPFSLPPGLVTSRSDAPPPAPPVPFKPPRSPLRPSANSGNELLQPASSRTSPVLSFKSFQSQQPSINSNAARSSISTSEPIGVRDVMRGQFLER
ncbi:hypothetical protein JCM16303_000668 [Sporobolomyces ruberrimus]